MWLHSSWHFLLEALREQQQPKELTSIDRNCSGMCLLASSSFYIWRTSGLICLYVFFTTMWILWRKGKHIIEGHWHVGVGHFQMFLTAALPAALRILQCLCIVVCTHEWVLWRSQRIVYHSLWSSFINTNKSPETIFLVFQLENVINYYCWKIIIFGTLLIPLGEILGDKQPS